MLNVRLLTIVWIAVAACREPDVAARPATRGGPPSKGANGVAASAPSTPTTAQPNPLDEARRARSEGREDRALELFSGAARSALAHSDFAEAAASIDEASASATKLADEQSKVELAVLRCELAAQRKAATDDAPALFDRALSAVEPLIESSHSTAWLDRLGLAIGATDGERALKAFDRWAAECERRGDPRGHVAAELRAVQQLGSMRRTVDSATRLRSAIDEGTLASDLATRARCRFAIGQFQYESGDSSGAIASFESALSDAPPTENEMRAWSEGYLGQLYTDCGEYARALALTTSCEQALVALHGDVLTIQNERIARANLNHRLGNYVDAAALLEELVGSSKLVVQDRERCSALTTLANVYESDDRMEQAFATALSAAEVAHRLDDPDAESDSLVNLGRLRRMRGDPGLALADHQRALGLVAHSASELRRVTAGNGIAEDLLALGKQDDVERLARETIAVYESSHHAEYTLTPLATLARLALARRDAKLLREVCERARTILDRPDLERVAARVAAGARSHFAEWGEFAQELVTLDLAATDLDANARRAIVERGFEDASRWKARALLAGVSESASTGGARGAGQNSLITSILERVGPRGALVELVEGVHELFAYVVADGAVRRLALGDRAAIESSVAAFLSGLSSRPKLVGAEAVARSGSELFARLCAPWFTRSDAFESVVVVPTATLAVVPFDALVVQIDRQKGRALEFGNITFLIDRCDVVYAPSTRFYVENALDVSRLRREPLVAFGDPVYVPELRDAGYPVEAAAASDEFLKLPNSSTEVDTIARLLRVQADDSAKPALAAWDQVWFQRDAELVNEHCGIHLGRTATHDAFMSDVGRAAVLHCAIHATADPLDPRRSALQLSFDERTRGRVTLQEIVGLRLDADLVVLSACETARGRNLRGEGVQSLAYAFLAAHAKSVIASVWAVDDPAGNTTMREFYKRFMAEHAAPREALRRAKLEVRKSGISRGGSAITSPADDPGQPYFWAPFVYIAPSERK